MTGDRLVIAYEPVWAIGTGKVPDTDQIGEVHDFIRASLEQRFGAGVGRAVPILYGGSVKAGNAGGDFRGQQRGRRTCRRRVSESGGFRADRAALQDA